jgi:Domain of unknown function (DUF5666)
MSTAVKGRLIRLAILAAVIAVIALCVAMCGPSNNSSNNSTTAKPSAPAHPPTSAPSAAPAPAPPPPEAKDYVEGLVESVSGNVIQLRTRTGSATVDFTPSTRVVEQTPAQLTDVTPGSCVNVRATPQSAPPPAAITAQAVTITSATDGKCPPPAGFYGTVTSVSGNTIVVNGMGTGGPTSTNVTVADSTTYNKQTASSSQAIEHGRCMGAQGTNSGGALQAMTIALQACPPMGRPHHHHHLHHLAFHI